MIIYLKNQSNEKILHLCLAISKDLVVIQNLSMLLDKLLVALRMHSRELQQFQLASIDEIVSSDFVMVFQNNF